MRIVDHEKRVVVLLVEDSDLYRNGLAHALETLHASVYAAKTHAAARELIGLHWDEIDAILLDACVEPPYLFYDAPELLKELARMNAKREPAVTIIGLASDKQMRQRLMRDGCTGALSKNRELVEFLPELLSDLLEQHLITATFKKPDPA
ncbi:MAG TPA: response regulator [Verrucomicrobiae bacterium]|nr:response regulator [Verrucomicrobiae bacterium]